MIIGWGVGVIKQSAAPAHLNAMGDFKGGEVQFSPFNEHFGFTPKCESDKKEGVLALAGIPVKQSSQKNSANQDANKILQQAKR